MLTKHLFYAIFIRQQLLFFGRYNMAVLTDTIRNVRIQRIFNHTIDETISQLKDQINFYQRINPDDFDLVKFNYTGSNTKNTENVFDPDNYPLMFVSRDRRSELWISCVSSGDQSENSKKTLEIFKLMRFYVSPHLILTCKPLNIKIETARTHFSK